MNNPGMAVILIVFVVLIVVLICREITCWYFKLNAIVDLLAQQNYLLSKIVGQISNDSQDEEVEVKKEKPKKYRDESPKEFFRNFFKSQKCQHCGAVNIHSALICKKCGKEL